jgi:hypothetical protein
MKNFRQRMINASEVGEYIFCAKAWKLKRDGARRARSLKLAQPTIEGISLAFIGPRACASWGCA